MALGNRARVGGTDISQEPGTCSRSRDCPGFWVPVSASTGSSARKEYSSTRIQYGKKDKDKKRTRKHADPGLGIQTTPPPPLGPDFPLPLTETEPPLNSQNRRQILERAATGVLLFPPGPGRLRAEYRQRHGGARACYGLEFGCQGGNCEQVCQSV